MTSCCLTVSFVAGVHEQYVCVKISDTDMQTVAHSSELRPKANSPSGSLRLVWSKPSTASTSSPSSVLLCQLSFPFIHVSLPPKTTFMTKHGVIPSNQCLRIPQRCQRAEKEKKPFFALDGLWMEETPSRRMRQARRHHRSVRKELSALGLV